MAARRDSALLSRCRPTQLAVHDEGSCWVPAVLRPAIVLSHWGRTDKEHLSDTGYWPDSYSNQSQCVDLALPAWRS